MAKDRKNSDPDRGPKMMEGEQPFDKGYESDHATFSNEKNFPGDSERGNKYFAMRNEARSKDSAKLKRSKFSKYA